MAIWTVKYRINGKDIDSLYNPLSQKEVQMEKVKYEAAEEGGGILLCTW